MGVLEKGMSRPLLKMPRLASLVEPYAASARPSMIGSIYLQSMPYLVLGMTLFT